MHTYGTLVGLVRRTAALSLLMAGTATLLQAQQSPAVASAQNVSTQPAPVQPAPLFLASDAAPAALTSTSGSGYSSSVSSSSDAVATSASDARFNLSSAALDSSQPPPRRSYGRPNYSGGNTNSDGSAKWTFMAGAGFTLPIGDTHVYETPGYVFQFGGGRNFNKTIGVLLQFDYDHFGLQTSTLNNQQYIYNYGCTLILQEEDVCTLVSGLTGSNHVWSFTLDPTFTLPTNGSLGAYAVVGGGFYHKVTNFAEPELIPTEFGEYEEEASIDEYTSNAFGVNGGFGVTYKFSHFSNERFYMEARYVLLLNSQRVGYTAANVGTTSYDGYDAYPANSNRTTYIPVTFGIRF
jgi:hypothetical protein